MRISESKVRQLVREEARKVMNEDIESALQGESITVSGKELSELANRLSTHMNESDAKSIILMWVGDVDRGQL